MKTYSGINALSVSKAQGLLKRLQHVDKNVRSVSAEFVHFIDTDATLSAADDAKLQQLLGLARTGVYGTATRAKVKGVQTFFGLPVTGIVDQDTWAWIIYAALVKGR